MKHLKTISVAQAPQKATLPIPGGGDILTNKQAVYEFKINLTRQAIEFTFQKTD